ncbi:hypothetical protein GHT06_022691 [Daphnia sinensis]|uniref:Angiotensin-converting enzyme n=1 Tax=Daphnia sinensis TaxID=1820382 RepID=A0AAD5KY81_9CRUS|nr:hypothetical protein GHT06_022691 [Daphnia sinensis]
MNNLFLILVLHSLFSVAPTAFANRKTVVGHNKDEHLARAFLDRYNDEYSQLVTESTRASWNYETNLTDYNAAIVEEVSARVSAYGDKANSNASLFDTTSFAYDTRRLLTNVGSLSLNDEEMKELTQVLNQMSRIYGSHKVCKEENCYSLEPELTKLMASSTNATERLWAWQQWHEGVGRAIRPLFATYVHLQNKQARLNGYEDYGDEWRQKYETKELESIVHDLYKQVEPLYRQLHAYVRRRLYETYGPSVIDLKGPLPAHLVGDMWGRFWSDLGDIVRPYPNKTSVDPTPAMIAQNYTVRRMFEMGNDFFVSMGLKPVPDTFFNLSMLEKPTDREVVCHATAWDFSDGKDFRIRMCASVSFSDFLTIHHELGHTQYQMQYAHLPYGYRDGANDGFHEAIGELMSMSVATTKHLQSVGLLDVIEDDPEVDINFLMQQALSSVSSLPFHLVQDTWRWRLFRGEIPTDEWNRAYWLEKMEKVGVTTPVPRDDPQDLDPVAIFHVSGNFDMIRYFTRTIMQFQFAQTLCDISDHVGPLHKCDFYNSTKAGTALAKMLSMGSSKPWPDAMETLTGQREMSVLPLLNYFRPLHEWLEKENARNGETIGWSIPPSD